MSIHHRPVEVVGVKVFGKSTSSTFYVKRYLQVFCSAFRLWSEGALRDICRLQTFPALGHLVGHLLALFEGLKSTACYPRVVHEYIFATVFWRDEAIALLVVEPLDRSLGHVLKNPAFLFLGFSARDKDRFSCCPVALRLHYNLCNCCLNYSRGEGRTGGSGEDTRPRDVPEFPRTLKREPEMYQKRSFLVPGWPY